MMLPCRYNVFSREPSMLGLSCTSCLETRLLKGASCDRADVPCGMPFPKLLWSNGFVTYGLKLHRQRRRQFFQGLIAAQSTPRLYCNIAARVALATNQSQHRCSHMISGRSCQQTYMSYTINTKDSRAISRMDTRLYVEGSLFSPTRVLVKDTLEP